MKWFVALIAAAGVLGATQALAAKAHIAEFTDVGVTATNIRAQIAAMPPAVEQPIVDFTSGHAESAAFTTGTTYIRVNCDTRCAVKIGPAGSTTATTVNTPLGPDAPEYFGVKAGQIISIVANP
ncbi:hypothetical protein HAP47_0022665 [Bradyrhizobium sp. 41S5]|uniref:Uncharacterized protein n=1 Tax=Bradyrhizobium erythrophlei TaxID=1437360 RepID=A0A1H4NVE9_9BRAD|nr:MULTISPECIES: hypothetical protein [Bradyrhizobium]UFX42066.1 hypothetical protein HAP47_0022665 [Bradyrhizobium sp. 41S5]SEB99144.1 hypothetical protein SAMN05444164_0742 [Bradyrhizobium erythrophlei]